MRINKESYQEIGNKMVSALEQEIQVLRAGGLGVTSGSAQLQCQTYTGNNFGTNKCPGLNMECFASCVNGHMKNLAACKVQQLLV